jgi:hypothetical protein
MPWKGYRFVALHKMFVLPRQGLPLQNWVAPDGEKMI